VLTPYFSKLRREQKEVGPSYRFIVTCVTGLAWPFHAALLFAAPYFVDALFGPNWKEIVPLVQVLCVGHILYHTTSMLEQVLTATGHIDRTLRIATILTTARIVVLGIAAFFSLMHVVMANLLLSVLRIVVVAPDLKHHVGVGARDHLDIFALSAPLGVAAALPAAALHFLLGAQGVFGSKAMLALTILASLGAWAIALALGNHPLKSEIRRLGNKLCQNRK
jgi:O-antigen/teichoic acid export membrane protein